MKKDFLAGRERVGGRAGKNEKIVNHRNADQVRMCDDTFHQRDVQGRIEKIFLDLPGIADLCVQFQLRFFFPEMGDHFRK